MNAARRLAYLIKSAANYYGKSLAAKKPTDKLKHIVVGVMDHYEPGTGGVTPSVEKARVDFLLDTYPKVAQKHVDCAGNIPKRTWFFPPHYHRYGTLRKLTALCRDGFGEIELHLHHGTICPDDAINLRQTLKLCVEEYAAFGIFGEHQGKKKFGFIHGSWALNNTRNGMFCGVNNEINILSEAGCYADFTFPSLTEADPDTLNAMFYPVFGEQSTCKTGTLVERNKFCNDNVMIIQGPTYPHYLPRDAVKNKLFRYRTLGDALTTKYPATEKRISQWINCQVGIKGVDDVFFVKLSTHGAVDFPVVLGAEMESIFLHLEKNYNDGINYALHYVSAREMYNIIKSLERGESADNIEKCRNLVVNKPQYINSEINEASQQLINLVSKTHPC
ncbi:MAG: hypothetical protein KUG79_17875 [Pseudomonadales bacterium]|nr:hypothetical protein [Pseudomonadales bacterium]